MQLKDYLSQIEKKGFQTKEEVKEARNYLSSINFNEILSKDIEHYVKIDDYIQCYEFLTSNRNIDILVNNLLSNNYKSFDKEKGFRELSFAISDCVDDAKEIFKRIANNVLPNADENFLTFKEIIDLFSVSYASPTYFFSENGKALLRTKTGVYMKEYPHLIKHLNEPAIILDEDEFYNLFSALSNHEADTFAKFLKKYPDAKITLSELVDFIIYYMTPTELYNLADTYKEYYDPQIITQVYLANTDEYYSKIVNKTLSTDPELTAKIISKHPELLKTIRTAFDDLLNFKEEIKFEGLYSLFDAFDDIKNTTAIVGFRTIKDKAGLKIEKVYNFAYNEKDVYKTKSLNHIVGLACGLSNEHFKFKKVVYKIDNYIKNLDNIALSVNDLKDYDEINKLFAEIKPQMTDTQLKRAQELLDETIFNDQVNPNTDFYKK